MKALILILTLSASIVFAGYIPKTIADITVSSAGTRQAISGTSILASSVCIEAKSTNAGKIYVGGSSVSSSSGIELSAGQAICFEPSEGLDVVDLTEVYIDASTSSQVAKIVYTIFKSK